MNIIEQIYNGIKRLLFGPTSYFVIRQGSSAFRGSSFVRVYREVIEYPMKILGIQFLGQKQNLGEYRILVDGEKIFPFGDVNSIEVGVLRNFVMPIEVSAGSLLEIEVRSGNPAERSVIVLDELDCLEMR